jgi:hypothetical protein
MDEDTHHNTDLIVLRLEAVRIACRVRTYKYLGKWGDEFTIRSGRPNGAKTELTKILEGWGDFILYGIADEDDRFLASWLLGNLDVFRLWFFRQLVIRSGQLPGSEQGNSDGSSTFRAFKINELPETFVVARKLGQP